MKPIYFFISFFIFISFFNLSASFAEDKIPEKKIDVNENDKRFVVSAFLNKRYLRKPSPVIVSYKEGFSAKRALFIAAITPRELYEELKKIGADMPNSKLEISFSWKGSEESSYRVEDLIANNRDKNYNFQFLGFIDNAEQYKSGELICLDFCQSGITGMSDIDDKMYERGEINFFINQKVLPANGATIKIFFLVKENNLQ